MHRCTKQIGSIDQATHIAKPCFGESTAQRSMKVIKKKKMVEWMNQNIWCIEIPFGDIAVDSDVRKFDDIFNLLKINKEKKRK